LSRNYTSEEAFAASIEAHTAGGHVVNSDGRSFSSVTIALKCNGNRDAIWQREAVIADLCRSWIGFRITNEGYETITCEAQGDIAYLAGTNFLEYKQENGTVPSEEAKFLDLYRRGDDSSWKVQTAQGGYYARGRKKLFWRRSERAI
jgi:hypothetical protein